MNNEKVRLEDCIITFKYFALKIKYVNVYDNYCRKKYYYS